MSKLSLLSALLFPPRCVGCGSFLSPLSHAKEGGTLCPECTEHWEKELRYECERCYALCADCTCMPTAMKQAKCAAFVKVCYYGEGEKYRVARHVLLQSKHRPDTAATLFAAKQMQQGIEKTLAKSGYTAQQAVLTHLPRTVRNRRRYGTDQAQELAKALSGLTGIPYLPLLARIPGGKTQKGLSAKERAINLQKAFLLRQKVELPCVILVDDVVTTGAGMAAAIRLLRAGGAHDVIGAGFAYTKRKKHPKP